MSCVIARNQVRHNLVEPGTIDGLAVALNVPEHRETFRINIFWFFDQMKAIGESETEAISQDS